MNGVTVILDTSFILRYLIGQPPGAARAARTVIDSDTPLGVSDVAIIESAYVLTTRYQMPRDVTVDALAGLVRRGNVVTLGAEKEFVVLGLLMCRDSTRVSFGDAMIWAVARSRSLRVVYTFDEHFPAEGLTLHSK